MQTKKKLNNTKPFSGYKGIIMTRHPSHAPLRVNLPKMPFRWCVRLGSTTVLEDGISLGGKRVEINEVKGIRNSANKLLMKRCFTEAKVKTAEWFVYKDNKFLKDISKEEINIENLPYPLIVKRDVGSRGTGNYLIKNQEELSQFCKSHDMSVYLIEHWHDYKKEYRIHVNKDSGCFYACRKMVKRDTPENERYQKHSNNCVWILQSNEQFQQPSNWSTIVEDCVKALDSLGLDIAGFDVIVQNDKDSKDRVREVVDYRIIESASAPSLAEVGIQHYVTQLPIIAKRKAKQYGITK